MYDALAMTLAGKRQLCLADSTSQAQPSVSSALVSTCSGLFELNLMSAICRGASRQALPLVRTRVAVQGGQAKRSSARHDARKEVGVLGQ